MNMKRNKVRHLREATPLSIIELARRVGLAYQTVSKMKRGLPTRKHSQLKVAKPLSKKHKDVF
jgi:DNA-binding XRE family transcriptional regulator